VLLPERAAWLPGQETLLIADVHLGKSATFRAAGMAVPEGIGEDLARLDALLDESGATRLVVLGDLFHAPEGQSVTVRRSLAEWRHARGGLEVIVTRGNHDRECADVLAGLGIELVTSYSLGDFECIHDPADAGGGCYSLGGHLHPAVRLSDQTRSFRLPCFWFGEDIGVLPAFGGFTGTHVIERAPGDRVYAVAEDRVVEV